MVKLPTIKELLKMQPSDLERECRETSELIAKQRLDVKLGKQKDTSEYKKHKKHYARMKTILTQKKTAESLSQSTQESTLSTSA